MKTDTATGLGYFAMAALVVGAVAFSASPAMAGNAYGKDENPGKAVGKAESTTTNNGNLSSAMGSLNAAHASAQGLAHANRNNSRVGMLAAYMDAMVVYQGLYEGLSEEDLAEYEAALAVLADPEATEEEKAAAQEIVDTIGADLNIATGEAAVSLKGAANKDGLIDATVVEAVNELLDGKENFTHSTIVHESEDNIAEIISTLE